MQHSNRAHHAGMVGRFAGALLAAGVALSGCSGGSGGGTTPPVVGTPTLTITSPAQNVSLPVGPVTVAFSTTNFSVGGLGQPHLRFFLDADPTAFEFHNAPTNQVLYQGTTTTAAEWAGSNQIRFPDLGQGQHVLQMELVDADGKGFANPESHTTRVLSVGVPAIAAPAVIPGRPTEGSTVDAGTIEVTFVVLNHAVGLPGQPHMRFFINDDPTPYQFYAGAGITEDNGVLYHGLHTHAVHWKSPTSFEMYGWSAGEYTLRFELVDGQDQPLANPEATATRAFSIVSVQVGEARLEEMISGINVITMAFAPDGRVFVSEGDTGNIGVITTTGGTWQLQPTPFYHVDVSTTVEQGTLGITIDPAFVSNGFVYLYHTAPDGTRNRIIRVKDVGGVGTQETVILDNIPAAPIHNGGIIHFGADGKLYVTTGEITQGPLAQDPTSLGGKILRLNSDGSIPSDNPIPGSPVYALGWRNGFGLTVHPISNDLWGTDNGPDSDDEVNRVVAGGNYGWPDFQGITGNPALVDPILSITPAVGITGIVGVKATPAYPATYHNTLLVTDVNTGVIRRLTLGGANYRELVSNTEVFRGAGGLIDLQQAPDGYVYAVGLGVIYRMVVN